MRNWPGRVELLKNDRYAIQTLGVLVGAFGVILNLDKLSLIGFTCRTALIEGHKTDSKVINTDVTEAIIIKAE